MSKMIKIVVIALFLAALLPTGPASSAKPSPAPTRTPRVKITSTPTLQPTATTPPTSTPTPTVPLSLEINWTQPTIPSNCTLGTDVNGSQTLVCVPSGFSFVGTAIIFAHGYVNPYFTPKTIPWDQMTFTDPSTGTQIFLPTLVTSMGYYFATTSYRAHGLVVQDAIQDLLLVRQKAFNAMPWYTISRNAVLAGVSEGGVITALSIERYASSYYAGLAMCGPYGNFQRQVNYWGDFRTLYDAYDINPLPPTAVSIPDTLITSWYGDKGVSALKTATGDIVMSEFPKSKELLDNIALMYDPAHPPYDQGTQMTVKDTILGLLDYNIFATNNGKVVLGGNPFGNISKDYPYSTALSKDLDDLVTRYTASVSVPASYETTGNLTKPLVIMHNLGDPIVPFWHVTYYQQKAIAAGRSSNFRIQSTVSAYYGHCNFTQSEMMAALDLIGSTALGVVAPSRENLLSGKALEDYQRIMNEHSESGKFIE